MKEMDIRENLVELIAQKVCGTWSESCDEWLPHDCGKCYANDCHISEIADHLIANGVTVQEWISVTERLPENIANRVLVVCERSNGVFYAHYEKPFWINLETDKPFISTVTHWMPLPNPPKGE